MTKCVFVSSLKSILTIPKQKVKIPNRKFQNPPREKQASESMDLMDVDTASMSVLLFA